MVAVGGGDEFTQELKVGVATECAARKVGKETRRDPIRDAEEEEEESGEEDGVCLETGKHRRVVNEMSRGEQGRRDSERVDEMQRCLE